MGENEPTEEQEGTERSLKDRAAGFGQKVLGEIEEVGGALTGDPLTQAEGQFNVDVGEMREGTYGDEGEDEEKHRV